jgi:hypothetical protein
MVALSPAPSFGVDAEAARACGPRVADSAVGV